MVGTLGSLGQRRDEVTANIFTLPALALANPLVRLSNSIVMRPASRSICAPAVPLYGTCVMAMPASDASKAPARWLTVPVPAEA